MSFEESPRVLAVVAAVDELDPKSPAIFEFLTETYMIVNALYLQNV